MSLIPFLRRKAPVFSLCHTTARLPDGWRKSAQAWFDHCDHPEDVEYILAWDARHGMDAVRSPNIFPNSIRVMNYGRECAVDGWNASVKPATGKFLISLSDDLFPCPHWDTELLKVIPDIEGEYVVEVSTGGDVGVLTFSMLTRAYFDRLTRDYGYDGGLFYSGSADGKDGYLGMYGDNDFTDLARRDGVVIDAMRLEFRHVHPVYNTAQWDDTYRHQQRPEAYAHGQKVYERRRLELGFPVPPKTTVPPKKRLALCMPGERFSSAWVANHMLLFAELTQRFDVAPIFCESSNVYVTRAAIAESIVKSGPLPDYVLWIDDDNIVTLQHALMLIDDLEKNSGIAGVCGWCWCLPDHYGLPPCLSVGAFLENGMLHKFTYEELMEGEIELKRVGFTGFPVFLMRGEVLAKFSNTPFAPILSNASTWGFFGEDVSFCIRASQAGLKFFVDRRVKVPHLKLRAAEPESMPEPKSLPEANAPDMGERKTA